MGLRPCRVCHCFLSEDARSCPHCGAPHPVTPEATWLDRYHAAVAVALVGLVATIWLFHAAAKLLGGPAPPPAPSVALDSLATSAAGQQTTDTAATKPLWRDSVRYGGGPSVGAPPSDYTGERPPTAWCLKATGRSRGDFGMAGWNWTAASRSWLHDVLSDATKHGEVWRRVLGGAPQLTAGDSIIQVLDEPTCHDIAEILNRDLLGWDAGPPPVVVFQMRDYLIAYPSNAHLGEFGMAVGMSMDRQIRGVASW